MSQGGMRLDLDPTLRELEALGRRTSRLQQFTVALSRALTVQDIGRVITAQGSELFGAIGSFLYVLDHATSSLELAAWSGVGEERVAKFRSLPLAAALPVSDAVRNGTPLFLGSLSEVRSAYPSLDGAQLDGAALTGVVVQPMHGSRADVGALADTYSDAPPIDEVQRDLLSTVAAQCGLAIERAQAFDSERRAHAAADAARAQLYALFMLSPAAVAIARGPGLRFELANEPFKRMFGAHLLGRTLADVLPELRSSGIGDHVRSVFETGERFARAYIEELKAKAFG